MSNQHPASFNVCLSNTLFGGLLLRVART